MDRKKLLIKSNEERLVVGSVYDPLDIDTDGEAMTSEEIRKMAYRFMEGLMLQNIDENHNQIPTGSYVVESYIAKKNDPDGFMEGSWVLGTKVVSDDLWEKVKSGDINGYSFHGDGETVILKASVELPVSGTGYTEDSIDGPLPSHNHKVKLKFDNNGNIISGKTTDHLGHSHVINKATATASELGHSHRLIFE